MRFIRFASLSAALLSGLSGCPAGSGETKQPATGNNGPVDPAGSTPEDPIATCAWVQSNPQVPVYCDVEYVDSGPVMFVMFPNKESMQQYLDSVLEHVAGPFCAIQKAASQPSAVIFGLGRTQAKAYDCISDQFVDVNSAQADGAVQQEENEVLTIGQACEAVQHSQWPVGCEIADVGGAPALVLPYQRGDEADAILPEIAEKVAAPFCIAANSSNAAASIFLIENDARARKYDCGQGAWSGWVGLRRSSAKSQRGASRQPRLRVKYDLLPE